MKKSIALALTAFTMLTGSRISDINAMDANKEKLSNTNKYLKYTMAYVLPCTMALVGGFGLRNKVNVITKNEKLSILNVLQDDTNINRLCTTDLTMLINNTLNGTEKHKKFERYIGKDVMVIRNFYYVDHIDNKFFVDNLESGTKLVFLGNIIGYKLVTRERQNLRNIIYLAGLQKLYPGQVIILKGKNEICRKNEGAPQEYLKSRNMYSEKLDSKIEKFINSLPLVCEIADDSQEEEKVYSFSFYPTQTYCKEQEKISRKCLVEGKMRKENEVLSAYNSFYNYDTIYEKSGFNQLSNVYGDIGKDDLDIRKISIDRHGIKISKVK